MPSDDFAAAAESNGKRTEVSAAPTCVNGTYDAGVCYAGDAGQCGSGACIQAASNGFSTGCATSGTRQALKAAQASRE